TGSSRGGSGRQACRKASAGGGDCTGNCEVWKPQASTRPPMAGSNSPSLASASGRERSSRAITDAGAVAASPRAKAWLMRVRSEGSQACHSCSYWRSRAAASTRADCAAPASAPRISISARVPNTYSCSTRGAGTGWQPASSATNSRAGSLAVGGLATGSDVLATGRIHPLADEGNIVGGNVDEAEAGPDLARGRRLVRPQLVRAHLDVAHAATVHRQRKTHLVQGIVHQRLAQYQQHAGFREVAELADDLAGHGVDDIHAEADLATLGATVVGAGLVHRAGTSAGVCPAKERNAFITALQARSIRVPFSSSTTRTSPLTMALARPSRVCSPTFWPRWLTNSTWPVTVENQDRRRRTFSPWLTLNSNQEPNGRCLICSSRACSSALRLTFFLRACCRSSPSRARAFRRMVSSVRLAALSSSVLVCGSTRRWAIAAASSLW